MDRKHLKMVGIVSLLAVTLLASACIPGGLLPVTGGGDAAQQASPNARTGDTSTQEGQPGDTIPRTGQIGPQGSATPGEDQSPFQARLIVNSFSVAPGDEIVIHGQQFPADQNIRIYLGRPQDGSQGAPIVTTQAQDDGQFVVFTILPANIPAEAITEGQLVLVAGGEDGSIMAETVVHLEGIGFDQVITTTPGPDMDVTPGTGGMNQQTTPGPVDMNQLGFNLNTTVLPLLSAFLGTSINPQDYRVETLEQTTWTDSCLGLGGPAESCALVQTPGYRLVFNIAGNRYEIRTDTTGRAVRITQPTQP